jgi:hypothetical protein
MKNFPLPFMYCSNLSCKFSRQTQKKLVGFSHYGHFRKASLKLDGRTHYLPSGAEEEENRNR